MNEELKHEAEREENKVSRRKVIGGLGATLATVIAAPVLASPGGKQQDDLPPGELANPLDKYPKPPFQAQEQPWPGLASKMNPRPDHGETSYKGSGRLKGRKALITGGDSGMGRAAAIAYAREGADVAINYYPTEEPDAKEVIALIKAEGRKAVAIPGDLRDEAFFDASRFPTATFVLRSLTGTTATGQLTLKGVTKPVSFPVVVSQEGNGLRVKGRAVIDRTQFGIRYNSNSFFSNLGDQAIKNEFALTFDVVARPVAISKQSAAR